MTALTRAKLALALLGLVMFGIGARIDHGILRWIGIGFVAAAWFLRFAGHRPTAGKEAEGEQESRGMR